MFMDNETVTTTTGAITWIVANAQGILAIVGALYTLALAIVKVTPTPKDDVRIETVGAFLKTIGVVFGLDLTQGINKKPAPPTKQSFINIKEDK
jgi:hypothetical protein